MDLATLKELESKATPRPWAHPAELAPQDTSQRLLNYELCSAMRDLMPEIIALWQSVNVLCYPPADCPATCLSQLAVVRENLDWLNSKLTDL